jgi:hypothetical protein
LNDADSSSDNSTPATVESGETWQHSTLRRASLFREDSANTELLARLTDDADIGLEGLEPCWQVLPRPGPHPRPRVPSRCHYSNAVRPTVLHETGLADATW